MEILPDRIRDRSNLESEPLSRHPRDLTQSCIPVCACEQAVGYFCQFADWVAV